MRYLIPAMVLVLGACSAATGKLDEETGTTLAQRCVDYRASLVAMDAAGESESEAYAMLKAFVAAYCPLEPAPADTK